MWQMPNNTEQETNIHINITAKCQKYKIQVDTTTANDIL
jgi:hypothetical protein